jgi:hypothetical protein
MKRMIVVMATAFVIVIFFLTGGHAVSAETEANFTLFGFVTMGGQAVEGYPLNITWQDADPGGDTSWIAIETVYTDRNGRYSQRIHFNGRWPGRLLVKVLPLARCESGESDMVDHPTFEPRWRIIDSAGAWQEDIRLTGCPVPTSTPTATATATVTQTAEPTSTATVTAVPTNTPTVTVTAMPTSTETVAPTPAVTSGPTVTPAATSTPVARALDHYLPVIFGGVK